MRGESMKFAKRVESESRSVSDFSKEKKEEGKINKTIHSREERKIDLSRESNKISYLLSLSFQISTRSHEQSFSSRFWSVLIAEQSLRSKVNLQPRSFFSSLNDLPIKTWKYKREYYTGEFKSQFNRKDASIYEFPVWKISFSFFSIECSHNGIPYILPVFSIERNVPIDGNARATTLFPRTDSSDGERIRREWNL